MSRAVRGGIEAFEAEVDTWRPKSKHQFVLCSACKQRVRMGEIKAGDRCPLCNGRLEW